MPANDDVEYLTIQPPGTANLDTEPATLTKKVQFSITRDLRPADDNQKKPASGINRSSTDNPVSEIANTAPLPPFRLREGREAHSGNTPARIDLYQTADGDTSLSKIINQESSPTRQSRRADLTAKAPNGYNPSIKGPASAQKPATASAPLTISVQSISQVFVVDHQTDHGYTHDCEVVFGVPWYGFPPDQNTDGPINHLPHRNVLQYCNRRGITLLEARTTTQVG